MLHLRKRITEGRLSKPGNNSKIEKTPFFMMFLRKYVLRRKDRKLLTIKDYKRRTSFDKFLDRILGNCYCLVVKIETI